MAPLVLGLMWILSPVAWPTAKLLDKLLGEDHGTMYKKAGLKTLVTLHRTLGQRPDERLNQDEVTIISAVLDLKDKPVGSIMTPMNDVFTLSANAVLDEPMMELILNAGYSRIPIYAPENPRNFVGMLLIKMLITYDPEDCLRVRDFALATLPETRPDTSCLDIVNFFQEGKSHMVLVSEFPGEPYGALGVVTLEDVIEELIGEEIIDESDVFVDVHKAIRRMAPAPRFRVPKGEVVTEPEPGTQTMQEGDMPDSKDQTDGHADGDGQIMSPPMVRSSTHTGAPTVISTSGTRKASLGDEVSRSPRQTTFFMRRRSESGEPHEVAIRSNAPEIREHLKHLGPRNRANDPKSTKINTVKIKPGNGVAVIPENKQLQVGKANSASPHSVGERRGLLQNSHSQHGSQDSTRGRSYGTLGQSNDALISTSAPEHPKNDTDSAITITNPIAESATTHTTNASGFPKLVIDKIGHHSPTPSPPDSPKSADNESLVGSLPNHSSRPTSAKGERAMSSVYGGNAFGAPVGRSRSSSHASASGAGRVHTARSGSITESTVDLPGGVKKIVLEMSSSNEDVDANGEEVMSPADEQENGEKVAGGEGKKRKRRKRAGKKKGDKAKEDENEPLLKS